MGDGFDLRTKNWIEILSDPVYRGDRFELGARDSVTVHHPLGLDPDFDLYFRQAQNWSIPGLKIDGLNRFLAGTAQFTDLISSDFTTLNYILANSNFNQSTDFAVADLNSQIQNTAERIVIFIGGNDIKEAYGTIYNGGSAGSLIPNFMANMVAILDRVQTLKPNIQIVIVNVPHVGITLKVKNEFPTDPVKTELVSAVLRDLNSQLASLAASRNLGFADVYTPTVKLLDSAKDFCVQGIVYNNIATASDHVNDINRLWLSGPISDKFHPNTSVQAVIANVIIDAFNKRYQLGIARLSATELLVGLLGKTSTQAGNIANADMTFATWMTRYVVSGSQTAANDADGDGIPAGMEFALGLDPTVWDADRVTTSTVGNELELAYPVRLPATSQFTLRPESSSTLTGPFTPFVTQPTQGTDGIYRARIPLGSGKGFLRLKATNL